MQSKYMKPDQCIFLRFSSMLTGAEVFRIENKHLTYSYAMNCFLN